MVESLQHFNFQIGFFWFSVYITANPVSLGLQLLVILFTAVLHFNGLNNYAAFRKTTNECQKNSCARAALKQAHECCLKWWTQRVFKSCLIMVQVFSWTLSTHTATISLSAQMNMFSLWRNYKACALNDICFYLNTHSCWHILLRHPNIILLPVHL